jgi:hypothetical protein
MKNLKIILANHIPNSYGGLKYVDGICIGFYRKSSDRRILFIHKLFPIELPQLIRYGFKAGHTKFVFDIKYYSNEYYEPIKLLSMTRRLRKI